LEEVPSFGLFLSFSGGLRPPSMLGYQDHSVAYHVLTGSPSPGRVLTDTFLLTGRDSYAARYSDSSLFTVVAFLLSFFLFQMNGNV